ncbi:hypothetical protein KO494_04500 [Lacinutrix sp. C3R15]|uniref:hypothetical protein n=1 Tax=Flavobacteriaceae TaxID=49546 RepID=UPI001C0A184E|nr:MULTISPECIES: hypothetical protein [Flavobacteriaceae]MBU2938797.1 hypothetical protein [Lacinutrix sp. C3R15]MDO6622110.1 hypothetical protein [Oceanihabitans sp. 1_MG-2023]
MKKTLYFLTCFTFLLLWSSCRKDFNFSPSNGNLSFSKDTVYLDTVFTNIGSSTYNLKVYNKSNEAISISNVKLALGEDSEYRLNVDGIAGKSFENVEILAKDSMYIFVETTIDINNLPNLNDEFLYTDKIEFDAGSNLQTVELVTLVQDAVFIYPDKDNTTGVVETLTIDIGGQQIETDIQGRYLEADELTFTNQKPYVIYGYAAVPNNQTLNIEAGARVHFHANSGLLVAEGASLQVNGTNSADQEALENQVIFEGDRLEPDFADVPGQWGTIWLLDGSINNTINYATIKNASVGILSEGNPAEATNKLTIKNSQIYNSSNYGFLGRNTSIEANNLVINNTGQTSFAATLGGKYNLTHCTIANYWNNSFRQYPALLINNFQETDDATFLADLTEANFNNCIIYGNDNPEFIIDEIEDSSVVFNFKFTNCLARFSDTSNTFSGANYDFEDPLKYENMIFNQDPDFRDSSANDLIIGEDSAANNQGNTIFASQVPFDILGVNRTASPDLGAYQHITFE